MWLAGHLPSACETLVVVSINSVMKEVRRKKKDEEEEKRKGEKKREKKEGLERK